MRGRAQTQLVRSRARHTIHHGDRGGNTAKADTGEHLIEQRIVSAGACHCQGIEQFGVVHHGARVESQATQSFSRERSDIADVQRLVPRQGPRDRERNVLHVRISQTRVIGAKGSAPGIDRSRCPRHNIGLPWDERGKIRVTDGAPGSAVND